jgi:hypothetical protein
MSVTTSMITGRFAFSPAGWRDRVAGLRPDRPRHVLGDAGEIDLAEGPHLPRLLGLGAAIDAVEPRFDWLPLELLLTTVTALMRQRAAVSISAM